MSENFESGLRDLYTRAAAAHSGSSGFPTTAMVATARRNRRVRAASVTLTTAAAVVGFGVAAVAMIGGRPQTTPATEPPESPAVVGTRANPACGMAVADLRVFAEPPASIDVALDATSVPSTGYLTGALKVVALDPGWGTEIRPSVWGFVEYAAVQGGQIVALPSLEGTATENAAFPLTPCADADEDGDLEPGQYDLWAFNAATIDGDDAYLIGGPWPFTLVEADAVTDQTPTEDPAGPPALEDLVISAAGLGPLRLGDPVPTAPGPTDIIRWDDQACAGTDLPGRWVPVYGQVPVFGGYTWYPFSVGVSADGTIGQLEVDATGPHTAEGIGVGSSLDELRAAYPDVELLAGEYSTDAWGLRSGGAVISFEVAARDDVEWSPEELDHVVRVHVLPADTTWFNNWGWGELCG